MNFTGGGAPANSSFKGFLYSNASKSGCLFFRTRLQTRCSLKNKHHLKCTQLKNPAFTLAEVLITLGIIGVVAAMTLPSLINRVQGKELEAQFKKGYSLISQVMQMMTYGEGQTITPEAYAAHKFAPAFHNYLIAAKACPKSWCLIERKAETNESGAMLGYDFGDYKTYNKKAKVEGSKMDNGQFMLKNGMAIYIENESSTFITIDVNGINQGPNLWGHDLFTFQLINDGKLLPMGAEGTDYVSENYCSNSSTSKLNGISCTYKAMTEKDYWKNLP